MSDVASYGYAENPVEIGSKKDSVGLQTHDTKLNTSGMCYWYDSIRPV